VTDWEASSPLDRRWRWEQSVPLRWLLVDVFTMGQPDAAVAVCVDVDGLFAGPQPAAPAEWYTLLGCAPVGRLRAAVDGTAQVWLGNLVLDAVHHPDRPTGTGCDPVPVGCDECMEELLDLTVVGRRPSTMDTVPQAASSSPSALHSRSTHSSPPVTTTS